MVGRSPTLCLPIKPISIWPNNWNLFVKLGEKWMTLVGLWSAKNDFYSSDGIYTAVRVGNFQVPILALKV